MISDMARGRRGTASPTSVAVPGADRVSELQESIDGAIAAQRDYFDEVLADLLSGDGGYEISRMLRPGGGLQGDYQKGAADLVDAALVASALGDDARATSLLVRARSHQEAYIAYLQLLPEDRRLSSRTTAGEALASARWLTAQIDRLTEDGERRRLGQAVILDSDGYPHLDVTAQVAGERLVRDALVAGEIASARGLLERLSKLMPTLIGAPEDLRDEDWEAARRLALSQRILGNEPVESDFRGRTKTVLVRNMAFSQAEVEYRRANRLAGAEYEAARSLASRQSAAVMGTAQTPVISAERWRARMRRALEGSSGYAATRLTAMVGISALRELAEDADLVPPSLRILASRPADGGSHLVTYLIASYEVESDGRTVLLEAVAKAGTTQARTPRGLVKKVADATGITVDADAVEIDDKKAFSLRPLSSGDPRPTREGAPSARRLLGRELCRHPNGAWVPDNDQKVLVLRCDDCQSPRVACVPFHRLPEDHELAATINDAEYIIVEKAHAALDGKDPDQVPDSIGGLRARDGVASLSPSSYGPPPPTRAAGRGIGVDDLAGRRARLQLAN